MKVNIKGRNLEITPALREYLEKRLSKFDKLTGSEEAVATLSVTKEWRRVEVTINVYGTIIRGEEEGYDMYTCIDNVIDKIDTRIQRYKSRLIKKGRNAKEEAYAIMPAEEVKEIPIKTKRFPIKPIPVDEAIMQMNLLGHSFFVFLNAEDDKVNVIYKRKDGGYGLLEPEA